MMQSRWRLAKIFLDIYFHCGTFWDTIGFTTGIENKIRLRGAASDRCNRYALHIGYS
jgi:hypothetical protein